MKRFSLYSNYYLRFNIYFFLKVVLLLSVGANNVTAITQNQKDLYSFTYSICSMYYENNGSLSQLQKNDVGAKLKLGLAISELCKIAKSTLYTKIVGHILNDYEKNFFKRKLLKIENMALGVDLIGDDIEPMFTKIHKYIMSSYDKETYIMSTAHAVSRINSFYYPSVLNHEPKLWEFSLIKDFDRFMGSLDSDLKPLMIKVNNELKKYIVATNNNSADEKQIISLIDAANNLHVKYCSFYPKLFSTQNNRSVNQDNRSALNKTVKIYNVFKSKSLPYELKYPSDWKCITDKDELKRINDKRAQAKNLKGFIGTLDVFFQIHDENFMCVLLFPLSLQAKQAISLYGEQAVFKQYVKNIDYTEDTINSKYFIKYDVPFGKDYTSSFALTIHENYFVFYRLTTVANDHKLQLPQFEKVIQTVTFN